MTAEGSRLRPMFPLGTVLFPNMVLPLHVFEPRYRLLVEDVLSRDREFGVTLITRGHEVGGGDVRTHVGTLARVLEAEELEGGRWVVVAVGRSRLRVLDWLEDDPYPRAVVVDDPDGPAGPDAADLRDVVSGRLRKVLALRTELGGAPVPIATDLDVDPRVASHQAAALAGTNPHDAQRLLEAGSVDERLALLVEVLDATEELLRSQLGSGGPPAPPDG